MRSIFICLSAFAFAALGTSGVRSATTGLAYDSVTRSNIASLMGQGPSTVEPAVSFDEAFDLASTTRVNEHPNFFNPGAVQKQTIATARNGQASRHYFLGSRQREDNLATETSVIIDCAAGTRTTLDNKAKTYRVEPLSASGGGSASGGSGGGKADDMQMTVKMTTSTLRPLTIDNQPTQGYGADMQIAMTKPGEQPVNMNMKVELYLSNYAQPLLLCALPSGGAQSGRSGPGGAPPQVAPMAGFIGFALSKDKHVTATVTGPPIPAGKLPVWQVLTPDMAGQPGAPPNASGFSIKFGTQNGHIRQLGDADAALFVPPADYKQQK